MGYDITVTHPEIFFQESFLIFKVIELLLNIQYILLINNRCAFMEESYFLSETFYVLFADLVLQ